MDNAFRVKSTFEIGERARISKEVTEDVIDSFAKVTGDYNPVHVDAEFANKTRFKGRIAHGMLGASLISAALGTELPGPGSIYLSQNLKFIRPVRIGDTLTAEVEVVSWDPIKRIVHLNTRCLNQAQEDVITGEAVLIMDSPKV